MRLPLTARWHSHHDLLHEPAHLIASEQICQDAPYSIDDVNADRHLVPARRAQLLEIHVVGKELLGDGFDGEPASCCCAFEFFNRALATTGLINECVRLRAGGVQ